MPQAWLAAEICFGCISSGIVLRVASFMMCLSIRNAGGITAFGLVFLLLEQGASAHAVAGDRVFPATLMVDDPSVSDELSLPTFSTVRQGASDAGPSQRTTNFAYEFSKRITDRLAFSVAGGYSIIDPKGQKSLYGFQNTEITLKYLAYVDPAREFITSAGVSREFGGSGAARVGAESGSTTTPTLYFGKGFGDLPDSLKYLKPFAVTGTIGYQLPDQAVRRSIDPDTGLIQADHAPDQVAFGATVQYSLPYLQAQVKDLGLPTVVGRLVPLVEISYTTPVTKSFGASTVGVVSPGVIYSGDSFQLGLEATIPTTRAAGTNVGVLAQFHLFFDDIFPNTLGKPLF